MNRQSLSLPAVLACVALGAVAAARAQPAVDASAAGTAAVADADPVLAAAAGVRELGRRWDQAAFDRTAALYTAVHRSVEWPGILAPEVVEYGPDPAQRLLLYRPEQGFSEPGPVVLFLHGNGLGERDAIVPGSDGLIYGHIGRLGALAGGIGVVAEYRTGAAATTATGTEDLHLMLTWLGAHVGELGGDPDTIVVLANSDGAGLVAHYLFDAAAQGESAPRVAAAILSSAVFGEAAPELLSLIEDYAGPRVPLALWSAEYDPPAVESGLAELYLALCRKYAQCPWFEQMRGHNHVSQVMSLGTGDSAAASALIRFYHTVR